MERKRFPKTIYAGVQQEIYEEIEKLAIQNSQTMAQVVRRLLRFSLDKIGGK